MINEIGVSLLVFCLCWFTVVWLTFELFALVFSKSYKYRKTIADMFVVGKIKKIAEKEGIDILEEYAQFAKFARRKDIDFEEIDKTIERELQEKIASSEKEKSK